MRGMSTASIPNYIFLKVSLPIDIDTCIIMKIRLGLRLQ